MDAPEAAKRDGDTAAPRPGRLPPRGGLPVPLTSFIGRERELATLRDLVGASRLVTLTGTGGSGKTRLAIELASGLQPEFRHGIALVDLAPLSDPEVIPQAILQALGVTDVVSPSPIEALDAVVEGRETLLLLDNCEHLVEACAPLVERLLRASVDLRVLATSREPLDIEGEVTVAVPPLSLPTSPIGMAAGDLAQFEAIRLFGDRASAARPGFVIDDETGEAVARLCNRLDGLPLAIELAAARMRSLSIDDIVERLDDRFSLLRRAARSGAPRHQTLRATVDWSHELLSDDERILFRRLAVFAGGWGLVDIQAVCTDHLNGGNGIIELHTRLVDRSLVVPEPAPTGPSRYRFLDTLRHYATERLIEAGEAEQLRRRHFAHFLAVAEAYYDDRAAGGSDAGLRALAAHRDNFRAALDWAAEVDSEAALRLTAALDDFWRMISAAEGWRWLQRVLATAPADSPYRLRALLTAGMLAAYIPAYAEGAGLLREASAVARRADDRTGEAWAELWLGRIAFFRGDPLEGQAHLERALAAHEALGNRLGLVRALSLVGLLEALVLGRHAQGEPKLQRAVAVARETGDSWGEGYAHMMLGLCFADLNDLGQAASNSRAALTASTLGPLLGVPLQGMARVALETDPVRAMRLLGAAAGHFQRTGTVPPPFVEQRGAAARQRAEQLLGAGAATRAWTEGRSMLLEEAIDYALAGGTTPPSGRLTRREEQVARLVARGQTNREVAGALHVSVRTAESHVDHILAKLGLRNRTELASWATDHLADTPR